MFATTLRRCLYPALLLCQLHFATAEQVKLVWDHPLMNADGTAMPGLEGFIVHYGSTSQAYTETLDVGVATEALITGLGSGQKYFFAVAAYNADRAESPYSDEATWTTSAGTNSTPQGVLVVGQSHVAMTNAVGVAGAASLAVWNAGKGSLDYAVSTDQDWLTCTPGTGTSTGEQDVITLTANLNFTPGIYTGTVSVAGAGQTQRVQVEVNLLRRYYPDLDQDGYGAGAPWLGTAAPAGYVAADGDCDDLRAAVFPGAPELADGLDNDCDGEQDEGLAPEALLDFDGDVRSDLGVYEPTSGLWRIHGSGGTDSQLAFGWSEAVPVAEDFDGDLVTDRSVYWAAGGVWYILGSSSGVRQESKIGDAGCIPVAADFDGDGKADLAVFNKQSSAWSVLQSSDGTLRRGKFGGKGLVPVPADYDGDGRADVAVFDPARAVWMGIGSASGKRASVRFGALRGIPVPADYDGDGIADFATYLAGTWRIRESSTGKATEWSYGWDGAVPVPADYDGDGLADACVYDPSAGQWYVRQAGGSQMRMAWGGPGSQPLLLQYQINRQLGVSK